MTLVRAPAAAAFDAEAAASFLRDVFAGQPGLVNICYVEATGGRRLRPGEFFPTDDAGLSAAAAHAARYAQGRPLGVYFRATTLSTRPESGRGGEADTLAVPVLWGDVDYGTDGHKGDGLPPTEDDALRVIAESGMPEPTILVHSGGGFYPLWKLRESPSLAEAKAASEHAQTALLRASQAHGWTYGTGVKDLARVLRLPGSLNLKTDVDRPCRVVCGSGVPISLADLPVLPTDPSPSSGPPVPSPARPYDPNRPAGPLDALAEYATWTDVLVPAGWTYVGRDAHGELWLRPGNPSSAYSARVLDVEPHVLVVHSDSADLPPGAGQRLTKGRVFAHLHHDGDVPAATRDLLRAAHGHGGSPAASALPAAVLAAVRAAHANCDPSATPTADLDNPLTAAPSPAPQATTPPAPLAAPTEADEGQAQQPSAGLSRFLLPAAVWSSSPALAHIYQAACARLVCPDAVLHAVLTILASLQHHDSRVDTGKSPSVLSYFLAVIGASGSGKSEALKVARELLATWMEKRIALLGDESYIDAPLGSGEGLIEAFMGTRCEEQLDADGKPVLDDDGNPKTVRRRAQVRHNALFHTDEGRQVLAIDARKGATVLAVLCEMWSGSVAGQTNAEQTRRRKLEAGSYVVGLMLGFQPATIDALFADEAGGAPQRFAYAPAEYAPFADDLDSDAEVPWPGELHPDVPAGPITVTLSPELRRCVRRAVRAKVAGISGDRALDGHRVLLHCRIAALLALLHGQPEVGDELWALAGAMLERSCALRDWLAAEGRRKAEAAARVRQEAQVATTVRAQNLVREDKRVTRAARQIARAVEKAGGALTRGRALHAIRSDLRDVGEAALDYAVRKGLVELTEDGRTVQQPERGGTTS